MDQGNQLFTLALGLVPPWAVDVVRFTVEEKRLDLYVNFSRGSHFPCPVCGQDCPVHDTQEKVWRHLDFFQHAAYLHARVPRVQCPEHGVHLVPVPWALGRCSAAPFWKAGERSMLTSAIASELPPWACRSSQNFSKV